jgi:hypothetical protein
VKPPRFGRSEGGWASPPQRGFHASLRGEEGSAGISRSCWRKGPSEDGRPSSLEPPGLRREPWQATPARHAQRDAGSGPTHRPDVRPRRQPIRVDQRNLRPTIPVSRAVGCGLQDTAKPRIRRRASECPAFAPALVGFVWFVVKKEIVCQVCSVRSTKVVTPLPRHASDESAKEGRTERPHRR